MVSELLPKELDMQMMGRFLWLWTVSVCYLCRESVNAQCAKFEFPHLNGSSNFTVTENTEVTIPFTLDTTNCSNLRTFIIGVSKTDTETNTLKSYCKISVNQHTSRSFNVPECKVEAGKGSYSVAKFVDRSDGTLWIWKTSGGDRKVASSREILLIVLTDHERTTPAAEWTTKGQEARSTPEWTTGSENWTSTTVDTVPNTAESSSIPAENVTRYNNSTSSGESKTDDLFSPIIYSGAVVVFVVIVIAVGLPVQLYRKRKHANVSANKPRFAEANRPRRYRWSTHP